tara:strand:+ start:60 stop:212 length:153 start_codon:yes stop_codon:yes gene_type:complete
MATYKEEQGAAVQDRPNDTGVIEGQVFYDTSSGTFKIVTDSGTETLGTSS